VTGGRAARRAASRYRRRCTFRPVSNTATLATTTGSVTSTGTP